MEELSVSSALKLVVRGTRQDTVINIGDVKVGGNKIVVIAGPCTVEGREQLLETAHSVKNSGASMLRGGAFKPRTLPYSFQGLGEEGLKLLAEAREETGLPIVTEVMSPQDVKTIEKYADVLQIGARNMQNFSLLKDVGKIEKPILLKRGLSAIINEWMGSAEYILNGGNNNVILCERGIRSFNRLTRFTLDIASVPIIKKVSHLPIIVDPSHAMGRRDLVIPMAKAAIAAGADGLIVEVHSEPEKALCDGPQQLRLNDFRRLMEELDTVANAIGRSL